MPDPASNVGYLSGPVDARKVYDAWKSGTHTDLFGTSYLQHWFAELERQQRGGVVVTSHPGEPYDARRGGFLILNRPQSQRGGAAYHLDMMRWTRERLGELEAAGAKTVVLTDAAHYWFLTLPFRRRGMRFVASHHCALRSLGHKRASPHEVLLQLTAHLHRRFGDPTMVIAPAILDELAREPGAEKRQTFVLRPDYKPEIFADFEPPAIAEGVQDEVRVLFAGRVEENKGVFDILKMAEMLAERDGPKVFFDIHGTGGADQALAKAVAASPHGDRVTLHGFTAGDALAGHYAASDIVIVPTRSSFDEGLAKSVVEGVLTLRPTVTSRVCPSLFLLEDACMEAEMDNPASYAEAIWQLATDPALARTKVAAARELRAMFFDPSERYDRQLKRALAIAEA